MRHYIEENIYYIKNEKDEIIFSIELADLPGNQIVIKTENEVYSGPIKLISF